MQLDYFDNDAEVFSEVDFRL